MAFELPPRLRLEERRSEKPEKSNGVRESSGSSRKGQPWTEAEHLQFLTGLKKLGRGNWRGISRLFVPTRTPTQVASHAQKHFLRTNGVCKRKSRFSLLEQAASAQGLLAHEHQVALSAGMPLPIFYGLPTIPVCQPERPAVLTSATSSDNSGADSVGARHGPSASCPGSMPPTFTKICRPVPYHASARLTDMAKLRADLAAAVSDGKLSTLQPSSRSAFFPVPSAAISV